MNKSFAFYDVSCENDTFHVQCEWLNVAVDLDKEDTNAEYGVVTITNLQHYWQCSSKLYTTAVFPVPLLTKT